ncbi:phospholipase D-like domain-containing protein [Halobacteriovorax sp.]|uniref:phospholipase D-like domain-containing protein n=1 Tax=Halobacteriovorax sp. TaxID=2020862 RepID=UPI0035689FDB
MRIVFFLILISFQHSSYSKEFNLQERINEDQYFRELYPLIHENEFYSEINNLKEVISSLDTEKRESVLELVNELNDVIPSPFLRPIIYWKEISPNKDNLAKVITYIMTYKLNTLRDYYQSPLLSDEEKQKAINLISTIYHRKNFTEGSLLLSLKEDFKQKSQFIVNFKKSEDFITALKETSPISFKLLRHSNISPYTLSFSGLIPGNQIKIFNSNSIDSEEIEQYSDKNQSAILTLDSKEHSVFKTDSIFIQLKEMIKSANKSIFISTKEIGGSIGLSAIKQIIKTTKEKVELNENFKVLILTKEDTPFIKFIKSSIANDTKLLSSIYIVDTQSGVKENNSKAIVIDANSEEPIALIGSKNWSDSKGGYHFDNDIWIKGPAAALIQNSFIYDLKSLRVDNDLIEYFSISRKSYPYLGDETIRLTESSLDSKINNTRDTIIDMIKKAQSHIYMEQLYLYDTYIINALIKRKLEVPEIDIRILADHNNNIGLNGLPNSIYLRELKLYNIDVKSRKPASINTNNINALHRENHRNTISIDGQVLHTGSASITPEIMQGYSREIGIQIYDTSSIRSFENNFLISWNDRASVMDLDIENFKAKTKEESISREISSLINAIASSFLAAKDEILKKF